MMSSYRPERTQRSFKSALLERSLASFKSYSVSPKPICTLAAVGSSGKQADDFCKVLWRVDVVRPSGRRHHVEELWVTLQDLAGAGVSGEPVQFGPQFFREDDWGAPFLAAGGDCDGGARPFVTPRAQ